MLADNHGRTTARYADEMDDLRAWWLREMIRTSGPLREVMTLFWHGHFTSSFGKVRISQSMYEQNAVFRRHALGNFRQLLNAVLHDSAMMLYLDMEEITGERHNENLARELCELFTLGVGNYSEADVREIARALTGWTLDVPAGVVKSSRPDAPACTGRSDATAWSPASSRSVTMAGPRRSWGEAVRSGCATSRTSSWPTPLPPGSWRAGSSPSSGRAIRTAHSRGVWPTRRRCPPPSRLPPSS